MKILQAGSNSIHVSSYIAALKNSGHEVHLLSEEPCNFAGVQHEWHVNFRRLNPLLMLKNKRKLHHILKTVRPDVIHIHQVNRLAYFVTKAAAKLKIPVITTAWGSDVLVIPKQNSFYRFLVRKSLQRSAIVTADSHEMIAAMTDLVPDSKKYVHVQYGIDPVTPETKENIIYSNRLHKPFYRIDQIVRYFAEFNKEFPDWQLVIGATGSETTAIEELVDELELDEKVVFAGWLNSEDNRNWYAKASVYISIPESDGTSVSVLEAMSAGCIPVLADLAVSREWIEPGVNGIIETAGKNPLIEALKLDFESSIETNRELVIRKASRETCVQVFTNLYQQLKHA